MTQPKLKKRPSYSFLFEKTITDFVKAYNLSNDKIYCASSGGIDSMALTHYATSLFKKGVIKNLVILHINHQTRVECEKELNLVKEYAYKNGVPFLVKEISCLNLKDPHFELKARIKRQNIFKSLDAPVWCAHHLDDSFEWNLRQQFSSSNPQKSQGIPVKTPFIRRPFLTVSKKQIKKYVKENHIPFLDDKSNDNPYFERAYLRKMIIPHIEKRYPKYLKHYAISSQNIWQSKKMNPLLSFKSENIHHYFLSSKDSTQPQLQHELRISVHELSHTHQGKIENQIAKINSFTTNGKMGPLSFSGGVKVYNLSQHLIVVNQSFLQEKKNCDFSIKKQEHLNYENFMSSFTENLARDDFYSFWCAVPKNSMTDDFRGNHPLLSEKLKKDCKDQSLKLISSWKLAKYLQKIPQKYLPIYFITESL